MRRLNYLKSLMLIVMALTVANMTGANVDSRAAQAKAVQFMNSQPGTRFMASTANMKLTHAEASKVKANANDYYVFNMDGGGYVIVSGDDRAEEILGYGSGYMDVNNLPSNVAWWLGHYKEQMEYLIANPKLEVEKPSVLMSTMLRATTVPQLMSSTWDQEAPYYNQCPTSNGQYCMTGCVATALAQVMYYWKYPAQLPAVEGYQQQANSYYGVPALTLNALPATTLDWDNMLDSYSGNYTTAQGNAVAKLMRYCGQASKMEYTPDGSGAYSEDQLAAAILFGYNSAAEYVQKDDYSATNWNTMMQTELQAGRPILYGGNDYSAGGHAFVVDGYNASTSKYHVNFGWSGYDDNYYALDAFTGSGYTFKYYQDMIIGVYPEGSALETYAAEMGQPSNVTSTSFTASWSDQTPSENVTDYTLYVQAYNPNVLLTETFGGVTATNDGTSTIDNALDTYCDNAGWTGSNVYQAGGGGLKLGKSSSGGSLTTPALDLSNCGGTIAVKINAKTYNTDATTLTVSCGNASQTVTLTSTATDYTVTLSGVTAAAGQKVTIASTGSRKRWYVYNVEITPGTAKLRASETGDASNRVITGITAKNYTVNNLTAGGSYKYYVVTNFTDGTTKQSDVQTVTLEGASTPTPELVVDNETLTMNANVNETATASFEVLGADLTGNVTLTLNDANGVYSINPTTISAADAEAGATVTVTYAPIAAGTHNATITVSSEDAEDVTVTINGTAAMQTAAPVMAAATNVATTSFTATWTDATNAAYVTDYTLYVSKAGSASGALLTEAFGGVTVENDGTARIDESLDTYCDNAGWTGNYVYQAGGGGLKFGNSSNGGSLTTPALDLSNCGGTITVVLNAKTYGTDATTLTVSCGDASETVSLTDAASNHTVTLTGVTAAAGQKVTIASTGSRQRWYLYSVNIYNGSAAKAVNETGDENSRVITGITAKTYTVENLTPGATYNFYVVANYTGGTTANSNTEQVTLLDAPVIPTPELVVDSETLTMTAAVGATETATFEVLGTDLTGNVTVTLTDETGYFTVTPASITIADAEEGATVTVTYAPTAAGEHTATITLSSEDAEDVTVTITGTATMATTAPVMLTANADYITTTSFRADWTDETNAAYVTDYTLYVNKVAATGDALLSEAFSGVTVENDGTARIESNLDEYCDNAGWTGSYVYQAGGGGLKFGNSSNGGSLTTPALDLSNCGGTITVVLNAKTYNTDVTTLTVSCGDASETIELTETATDYTVTLTGVTAAEGQQVTISSTGSKQRWYLYSVNIYDGSGAKVVSETGDVNSRVITGITDKTYTVENLTPGATYNFYVVANYTGGTTANSNTEQVTLLDAPVIPTPELVVDSETLTMTAAVGETVTATFEVLGSDLTGNVTVTLSDETGYFTVDAETITITEAEEGATVTVSYAPTAAGEHTATITLSSEGAEDVTVTITGTATMATTAPVMLTANADYITTTSFRADWTDETNSAYVTDYTLYVNKVAAAGNALLSEAFSGVTVENDGTARIDESLDTYCDNAGWTGNYVYQAGGGGLKFGNSSNGGYLTTPALDLSNCGGTITVVLNAKTYGTDATTLTVSCGDASETIELTETATDYTVTLTGVTAAEGQQVTISSTGSKQRWYLYSVNIYDGSGAKAVSETGDVNSRVITGITDKTYTVENLTPGATYNFYVVANYTDGTTANSNTEQVTLLDAPVIPTPELVVDPETLTMIADVDNIATATFEVLGSDLTGNVTVTLSDETGYFTVDAETITITEAEEGATVTVSYAPTAAGEHTATITLSSEGAEDVTVTINGTAEMETLAPEMQPADEEYITTTSFRADWVDVTPEQYVTDYTLYVNKKQDTPDVEAVLTETFGGVTVENDGTARIESSLDTYCDNAGWTGNYVYQAGGGGLKFGNSSNGGYLTSPVLDLTNCSGTITVVFSAMNYGTDATTVTVSCGDVSETVELSDAKAEYTVILTGITVDDNQQVTIASNGSRQRWYLYDVTIYNGEIVIKAVSETGDEDSRVITGITDQFYVVENLTPGATYTYYVEANYIDGTKAASNVEEVTLLEDQGHGYELGDVNHDGTVSVLDVTSLIDYLLGSQNGICLICADFNGVDGVSVADVTALIDYLLSGK